MDWRGWIMTRNPSRRRNSSRRGQQSETSLIDKTEVQNIIAFTEEALRQDSRHRKSIFREKRALEQQCSDQPHEERKIGLIGEEIRIAEEMQKRRASDEARQINAIIKDTEKVRSRGSALGNGLSFLRNSLRESGRLSMIMTQIEDLKERRRRESVSQRLLVPPTEDGENEWSDEMSNGDSDGLEQLDSSTPDDDETPVPTLVNEPKHHPCSDNSLPLHFSGQKYLDLMDKLDRLTLMCEHLKRENTSLRKKLKALTC